jgi:uncharacterized protein YkwD
MVADRFDRRSFIKAAAVFAVARPISVKSQIIERGRFSTEDVPLARQALLELVNAERWPRGLSQLELDDFACGVADQHAEDMLDGMFLSHWGRDGRKPYQRYSFAGGTDAIQENVSSADNIFSMTPVGVQNTLVDMHNSMILEVPPYDGHRRTILSPRHTRVGFGIAARQYSVRLDEIYIERYTQVDPIKRIAKPGSRINFSGRLLNPKDEVNGVYVYHEPLPTALPLEWLRIPRSYSMPDTFEQFLPRLPGNYVYVNGVRGVIETNSKGAFRAPVKLFKRPGINTIVLWIRRARKEPAFPVTQVCIRCE